MLAWCWRWCWMDGLSDGLAHFAFNIIGMRASAGICATQNCTGPNHELALVMTKERAGVMAEPSVLPQRTEFQRVEMA